LEQISAEILMIVGIPTIRENLVSLLSFQLLGVISLGFLIHTHIESFKNFLFVSFLLSGHLAHLVKKLEFVILHEINQLLEVKEQIHQVVKD
jgi:hypothetical protein